MSEKKKIKVKRISPTLRIPDCGFHIIYADPPWKYDDTLQGNDMRGGAGERYDLLKPEDLENLSLKKIAAKDCALFLWVTSPQIPVAIDCIRAWGFTYKTVAFVWRKMNTVSTHTPFFGLGRWTRSNYEYVLFATRGKPKRRNMGVRQEIAHPIMDHSVKPIIVRDEIEKLMVPGFKVELFAREKAPGWQATGLELDEMDIRDIL